LSRRRIKAVKLVTVCSNCGEAVEIIMTKKQLKELLKEIKLPVEQASLRAEERIMREMRTTL